MLIGGEHRNADQQRPAVDQDAYEAFCALGEAYPDDDEQADVQRRRLVVRQVEARQNVEHRAEHAIDRWPLESEMQREGEEARDGDDLRREQAQRMAVDLARRAAEQERQPVQKIDRPVGHDRPGNERNVPFPLEEDAANAGTRSRIPIRKAVAQEEKRSEQREPRQPAQPALAPALIGGARVHHAFLRASETVKMPHSSMRCSIFSKPAASTS